MTRDQRTGLDCEQNDEPGANGHFIRVVNEFALLVMTSSISTIEHTKGFNFGIVNFFLAFH